MEWEEGGGGRARRVRLWSGLVCTRVCPANLKLNSSMQFNAISEKLAAEWAAKNNPNFTVVVQPGLSGIPIAKYGEAYLSSLDCFHPSLCANQAFTYMVHFPFLFLFLFLFFLFRFLDVELTFLPLRSGTTCFSLWARRTQHQM